MSYSRPNASDATETRNRTPRSVSPFSGMCSACQDGCEGMCEIGRSAVRGKEIIYPRPFGLISAAAEKDYPLDFSHFNILGTAVGAEGIEPDSDRAIFPAVRVEREIGAGENKIKVKLPVIIGAMGSTKVAAQNWEGLAAGAAISGTIITVGENVCGMDPEAQIKNGRVVKSPELARRVRAFREWYDGYGAIAVQANVEDTRLGVLEYAISDLGVEAVEMKWGQGAKSIGGEVQVNSLEKALMLKKRGYIVLPDPEEEAVQIAFSKGAFKEFERHSRVGMVNEEEFCRRVEELRRAGARFIFLKTGAYRPKDLALAVKLASVAGLDLLIVDGAGGGTGMSPWRMMNEWGIPTIWQEVLLYKYLMKIAASGAYIPPVAVAGGFTLEDHVFKGLALGAPFVKLIAMARAPLTAAMVAKNVGQMVARGNLVPFYRNYGNTVDKVFLNAAELKNRYGPRFKDFPIGALGVYNYFERLKQGLCQLLCGARKFSIDLMSRKDLAALTTEAAKATGITYISNVDAEEADKILDSITARRETYVWNRRCLV